MPRIYAPGFGMKPAATELGQFIRRHRLQLGLTQRQVNKLAGFSYNLCAILEEGTHGQRFLKPEWQKSLALALNCPLEELQQLSTKPERARGALGSFLRQRRLALGLGRREFCQRAGICYSALDHLESGGRKTVRLSTAQRLASALSIPVSDFKPFLYTGPPLGLCARPTEHPLGKVVRERRQVLGLSQAQLGQAIGSSKQLISLIELGQVRSSQNRSTIASLERVLSLSPNTLQRLMPTRAINTVR